jgi:GDP-L-fucose synthase
MIELKNKKILVTGGNGFIGSFVVDNLQEKRGVRQANIIVPASKKDDIRVKENVLRLIKENDIDIIIHLAALIGGINYSTNFAADQYYNNTLMDLQVVEAAKESKIEKIVLVSSSCAYPRDPEYPLKEEFLWDGLPQESNRAYGVAKRNLIVQAEAYSKQYGLNAVVVIPNNAYGPKDNFHPEYSHVIPSLIRKCLAGENPLVVWGDGTPTRDFLYVKDFAEGVVLAAEKLEGLEPVNLGSGTETSIKELVNLVIKNTGYNGAIKYDTAQPNGQPRRSVDISRAKELLGFNPEYSLEKGLQETIEWYKNNK